MNENRKEFVFVIGKSEGMEKQAMLDGINYIAEKQKKIKDESTYTLVFFGEQAKTAALCKDIKKMRKYAPTSYSPKGRSALYDAFGYAIDTVGEVLSETDENERPAKVCVIAIGEKDNASTVYEKSVLDAMIKRQKYVYKWDFILYTDEETGFDIGKGGNLSNPAKMFEDINDYIACLRKLSSYNKN